jgi:ribulose-bisphosphate carboxylase large chain
LNAADVEGFFANPRDLDPESYLWLEYYIECVGDPRTAAAHFCSEQSTAQWQRVGHSKTCGPGSRPKSSI